MYIYRYRYEQILKTGAVSCPHRSERNLDHSFSLGYLAVPMKSMCSTKWASPLTDTCTHVARVYVGKRIHRNKET